MKGYAGVKCYTMVSPKFDALKGKVLLLIYVSLEQVQGLLNTVFEKIPKYSKI